MRMFTNRTRGFLVGLVLAAGVAGGVAYVGSDSATADSAQAVQLINDGEAHLKLTTITYQKWLATNYAPGVRETTEWGRAFASFDAAKAALAPPPPATTTTTTTTTVTTTPTTTTVPTTTTTPIAGCDLYASPTGTDTNAGTQTAPFQTVAKLAASIALGQTGCLRAGVYQNANAFDWARTATAAAPLAIQSAPGETATILMRVKLSGAYLTVRNIVVGRNLAPGNAGDAGDVNVWVAGTHNTLERSEVKDSNQSGVFTTGTFFLLDRNYIHDNGNPLHVEGSEPLDHGLYMGGTDGFASNNLIVRSTGYGAQFWSSCARCRFVENTVAYNGTSSVGGHGVLFGGSTTTGSVVANNVIAFNSRDGVHSYALPAGGNNGADSNVVFGNGGVAYQGSGYTVTNPRTGDPLFASSTDFHVLAGSPAVDAANVIYATGQDLDGVTRPVGAAADIGAYER